MMDKNITGWNGMQDDFHIVVFVSWGYDIIVNDIDIII